MMMVYDDGMIWHWGLTKPKSSGLLHHI